MPDNSRLRGVRVLIVDDAPYVLTVVTAILEADGAVVTAVDSADTALEILQRERPDVLLSDLSMPGKGGFWLIGQVRALPPDRGGATPAAALPAYTGPEHPASGLRAGVPYHVAKPGGMEEVMGAGGILAVEAQQNSR